MNNFVGVLITCCFWHLGKSKSSDCESTSVHKPDHRLEPMQKKSILKKDSSSALKEETEHLLPSNPQTSHSECSRYVHRLFLFPLP